jgi:hypothetical protein
MTTSTTPRFICPVCSGSHLDYQQPDGLCKCFTNMKKMKAGDDCEVVNDLMAMFGMGKPVDKK